MKRKLAWLTVAGIYGGIFALNPTLASLGVIPPAEFHNSSISMPVGRYVYEHNLPPAVGEIVVIRRARDLGYPVPHLIKRVAAIAGQEFCWQDPLKIHTIDGKRVPNRIHHDDMTHLPIWLGCRMLDPGEIIVLGDHPRSFDSRFFGPVNIRQLWGVYRHI